MFGFGAVEPVPYVTGLVFSICGNLDFYIFHETNPVKAAVKLLDRKWKLRIPP